MKFALISQAFIVQSYQNIAGKAYDLYGKPYRYPHSIGNEFFMGYWNYPFLFEGGYYLNFNDINKVDDLDISLVANDSRKDIDYDTIRNRFPNACIIATVKEMSGNDDVRREFFEKSDFVCSPLSHNNPFTLHFKNLTNKKVEWVPQPVNIEYLYDNFYRDKNFQLFSYQHNQSNRTSNTLEVAKYLSNKFNLQLVENFTHERTHGNNSLFDHTNSLSKCLFFLNMDPTYNYGQISCICASIGTICLGSNNDVNNFLYPKLNGIDVRKIELELEKMLSSKDYMISIIENAFNKLNELYSYSRIRKKILDMYEK